MCYKHILATVEEYVEFNFHMEVSYAQSIRDMGGVNSIYNEEINYN